MKTTNITILALSMGLCVACSTKNAENQTAENATEAVEEAAANAVTPEGPEEARGEVWTMISGCYFFGDTLGNCATVDVLSDEGTFNFGGEEYPAKVDETTGQILAHDADGNLVFCGYMYDGGNSLGGNMRGTRIFMQGPGD